MPPVSEAQRRFFHAQARPQRGRRKRRLKMSVAKELASEDPGGHLPARIRKHRKVKGLER